MPNVFVVINLVCEKVDVGHSSNVPLARTFHGGVALKNQLLVYGGGEAGQRPVADAKVHVFNPDRGKWIGVQPRGECPDARHGHVMVNVSDRLIYMHGGMSGQGVLICILRDEDFVFL